MGFLDKLLGIFGNFDPEAIKRKKLKEIAKQVSKSRFKFYKSAGEEVLPVMAKFFYDIYKAISPAQLIVRAPQASAALRMIAVENSFTDRQKEVAERLTEQSITERAKTLSPNELSAQVKEDIRLLYADFDKDIIDTIDNAYSMLLNFSAFVTFDYFFLLKKFDSNLQEHNFTYAPKFEAIRSEYVKEDLADFITVAWPITSPAEWQTVFSILKAYKDIDPIPLSLWNKLLHRLNELRTSGVIEMILQLIAANPLLEHTFTVKNEHIVDAHLDKMRTQAELLIKKIQQERKNSKSDDLLKQLFNSTAVVMLKNYSEQKSVNFEKRMLGSFRYAQPLNYLKAFLIDYFKKDIREIADLVLVRGKWTVQTSANQMSEAYHILLEISNQITAFDETLSDEGEIGAKCKNLLTRSDRDKEAGKIIRTLLRDANEKARNMLTDASQNFIVFAKNLKNLLEDKEKPHPELIANWKEIEHATDTSIRDLGVGVYKKIFLFISLMQIFLTDKSSE